VLDEVARAQDGGGVGGVTKSQEHEARRFTPAMWAALRHAGTAHPVALVGGGRLRTGRLLERRGFVVVSPTARGFYRVQFTDAGREALKLETNEAK
jgi:hypothetical protein